MISVRRVEPVFRVQRSTERAHFDFGWLSTSHSFSFGNYHDETNVNWGALRVLNDDHVAPGAGFPTHGHADMEIVTYVLEGQLEHHDSTGSHGIVGPGGVQFMSAGRGVRHSEYNHSPTQPLHFLQMWVIPGRRGTAPSYGQAEFGPAERRGRWLALASGEKHVESRVRLTQSASFFVARLDSGDIAEHAFETGRLGFLFVASGDLKVDGLNATGTVFAGDQLFGGDAVRLANVTSVSLSGTGEVVIWDVPTIDAKDEAV